MIISLPFFAYLVLVAIVYRILPWSKIRVGFLSLSSLAFVAYLDRSAAVVTLCITVWTYLFAWLLDRYKKAIFLRIGIIGILGALIAFKYLGLLSGTLSHLAQFVSSLPDFRIENLLLPLGISYLTFKHISYLSDLNWKIAKRGSFLEFLSYSSLFTIFVAGPIERFSRYQPQLEENHQSWQNVWIGFQRIVFGLFKKLVIADWIGYFIQPWWDSASFWMRALALLGYSIQIYTDFAGYSDIAIGSSRILGLKIMENFNNPYFRTNMSRFWATWHISLSEWIRDYLFFPLSRVSRKVIWSLVCVPIITMAACGIWHGAAWHFMYWGIWHGAGIAVYQLWIYYKRKRKIKTPKTMGYQVLMGAITFTFVTIGWMWFR